MMTSKQGNYIIAGIWIANGLFCKVLNLVPRHEQIVAAILGEEHSGLLTKTIGFAETAMAIWILSGIRSKWSAVVQMAVIATMNILEYIMVPELLLWGKMNSVFALIFILFIYVNEFKWNRTH